MATKKAIEPGTVLRVGLDDQWHTYARALRRPTRIAFFDCRTQEPVDDLHAIVERPVLFAVEVARAAGHWPVVGHLPPDVASIPVPEQFLQDAASGRCEIVDEFFTARPATPEECVGLERVAVWEPAHVEDRLRHHYAGLPYPQLEVMKVEVR